MSESAAAPQLRSQPMQLHSRYQPLPGRYDEMCDAGGALRPHWEYLIGALQALGATGFEQRCDETRRQLYDNGVTYNVYADQQQTERLWPLDPIPLLITSGEWSVIEQGVAQRAELLALVLADLYGPRQLLRRGLLPPELLHIHPGFLRPCAGSNAQTPLLSLYAADLARTPDGSWQVIGDRSQAPSGAGYAVENRMILSRVFPSLYRDSEVHRLALFFRSLRAHLNACAPRSHGNPRIVVLTPGPESETYFEHAYLAAYLGYALVQGSDLVVRDDCVWLKALDGLRPVDVILRRVDDEYCDPLELRGDSVLGTPGLLQAARLGNVAVANPLGSSVLENPGFMPFLPGLARALLGEDLRLPSVPTWWCGEAEARTYALEHLEQLVVKPIFPHASAATVFAGSLSKQERWQLAEQIRSRPHLYVAQPCLDLSTAPAVAGNGLEPRPLVLRSFAVAGDGGYAVMPGGLARVAPRPQAAVVSNQLGGVSKDVWVLASEPERQVSLLVAATPPTVAVGEADDVPGRVADDLFWLGRYAERSDGTARLLREILLRLVGPERGPQDDALRLLLRALTVQSTTYPGFTEDDAPFAAPEGELQSVLFDRSRAGSLRFDIDAVVRVSRSLRDRLSSDAARVINSLQREFARVSDLGAAPEAMQRVIVLLAAFGGLCNDCMSRGQGWRFLAVGRYLERAVNTVTLLQVLLVPAARSGSVAPLEALLAVMHSLKTFRRRYRSQLQLGSLLDVLVIDEDNPRSAAHQLRELDALIVALEERARGRRSAAGRIGLDLLTRVRLFDLDTVGEVGIDALATLLASLAQQLGALSDELTREYFSHAEAPQQLVRIV